MKTFYLLVLLACLSFGSAAFSAPHPPHNVNLAVNFDHTSYSLQLDPGFLTYKTGVQSRRIQVKPCNRSVLEKLTGEYRRLEALNSIAPPIARTKYDVSFVDNERKLQVARGSKLGTWLRNLPREIPTTLAEAQVSCRK